MSDIGGHISDGLGTRVEYHDRPAEQRAVLESVRYSGSCCQHGYHPQPSSVGAKPEWQPRSTPARRNGAPSPGMTSSSSATATSARAGSDTSDVVLEWVECPDLDRLLVGTVGQTFRSHEGDRFIGHDRGMLGAWTLDERARLSGRSFRSVASCVLARCCACVRRSGAASPGMRRGGPVAASRRRSGGRRGPATRRH